MPAAADSGWMALGFFPLFATGWATACRIEGMPDVAAGTLPHIGGSGFPVTLGTSDFDFSHGSYVFMYGAKLRNGHK